MPQPIQNQPFFTLFLGSALLILFLSLSPSIAIAQDEIPEGVIITSTGMGRTTGPIAKLTIRNTTDTPYLLDLGPLYIPTDGKYQPYILPETPKIAIPASGTISIPLEGYCADIHKAPAPLGYPLPPFDEWPRPQSLPYTWEPEDALGWVDARFSPLFIPGTDRPLGHTIDIDKYPEAAAPVLLEAIRQITSSTDLLIEADQITTPFHGQPEKERESIIQQTFWIFSSALSGTPYTKEQFAKQTFEQFETNTGRPVESLREDQREELEGGVDLFWSSFEATGVQAKILQPGPGIVYQERPVSTTSQCACDSLTIQVRILDGDREVGTETMTVTRFTQKSQDLNISAPTIKEGDDLHVEISGITMSCSCGADAMCTAYPPKRTGGPDTDSPGKVKIKTGENEDDVADENFQCLLTNDADDRWNEAGTTYTMDLHFAKFGKHDSDPFQCIQLTAWCAQDDCKRKRCNQKICLRFTWKPK
ncbi:MAG: hypothetical protein K9I85_03235 [Saprospiraceae bacterium]|nr:hypothetical protein [Saprospiraceae bacterium]